MKRHKYKTSRGAAAKLKGNRAELRWRNELRRIYDDASMREKIKRVPMSGASWMKGDVVDLNDYDTLYEVKNQESLGIPAWWHQTIREAGTSRTAVLVVTQSYRPFYVFMQPDAAEALVREAGFGDCSNSINWKTQRGLLDAIDRLDHYGIVFVDFRDKNGTVLVGMKGEDYIACKRTLTN